MFKKLFYLLLIITLSFKCYSAPPVLADEKNKDLSFDLQNVEIRDVIYIFAKFLHQNVIISSKVTGLVSLHLHDMPADEIFDLLLLSHDLIKQDVGHSWFVTPRQDLIQHQEDQIKLHSSLEEASPVLTRIWQIHYAKAEDIAHLLQNNNNSLISKRGHLETDIRTNVICIQDTAEHLQDIQKVITHLDVPVQQVLIATRLASIDSDCEHELGVNFTVQPADGAMHPDCVGRYGLVVARLVDGSKLDVQLSALEKMGKGELISSPSLFTANQQTASIESGEEIPYQEESESGGTAVAFKKAVLSLKVTPQIMPNNQVLLQLHINQDRPSSRIVQGVPAINTRQITTNILVKNGQTIVLGGIYESNREHAEQGIPCISKIPLVGWLFKQQNVLENKRELLIFVTPKIISER